MLVGWMAASLAAGADLSPSDLLGRIRTQMSQTLARLPDYTCRETIQRYVQPASATAFEPRDLLRVEVAYLGGRESYAWPGSPEFGDQKLVEMAPGGSIGTGNFGALGKAVFASDAATFTYAGQSALNGRKQVQFNYRVPLGRSGYAVHYGKLAAVVPYHGWFAADPVTNDVIAFEVDADQIPKELDTREARERVEYVRVRIGGGDYLLPRSSETVLIESDGKIDRNQISFTDCRQYTGESTLSFTAPGDVPAARPASKPPEHLPRGLQLQVRLATPIERGITAIGDTVQGEIAKEVRRPVKIPKGAAVTLRVTRMDTVTVKDLRFHVIAFDLLNVTAAGAQYEIANARLEAVAGLGRYAVSPKGLVSFRGPTLEILPGLQMEWQISE